MKKIKIDELKKPTVKEKIIPILKKAKENGDAYNIQGLMIDVFNVKEKNIKGVSFKDMPEGYPTLYSQIKRALDTLIKENKVIKKKFSKSYFYYWK